MPSKSPSTASPRWYSKGTTQVGSAPIIASETNPQIQESPSPWCIFLLCLKSREKMMCRVQSYKLFVRHKRHLCAFMWGWLLHCPNLWDQQFLTWSLQLGRNSTPQLPWIPKPFTWIKHQKNGLRFAVLWGWCNRCICFHLRTICILTRV